MNKMANPDHLKALLENPEFLKKFQNLVNEHSTSEIIENGDPDSTTNKTESVENGTKSVYKRETIVNQSPQKQNNSIEEFKSLLQKEGIKEKIVQNISDCIPIKNNSDNSSDEKVVTTTQKNTLTIGTTEDVKRLSVEEILFPNYTDVITPSSKQLGNIRIKRKSLKPNESQLILADTKHSENILLDKKTNFVVKDQLKVVNTIRTQGAGVLVNKETINESLKKSKIIRLVPIQFVKTKHISPVKTNPINKHIALEQPTDLKTQNNEESLEMSQSDDIYYLSMVNGLNTSESDISDIPQVNTVTSNNLGNSHIDATITIEPNTSTPKNKPTVSKSVVKNNDNVITKIPTRLVKRFIMPTCKIQDQISETNPQSVDLVNSQNTSTIIVLTDNGEQSIKIQSAQKKPGPKPIIKSNERVLMKGKTIRKIGDDINDSVVSDVSDNIITNDDSTGSFKLPKIESVMSYAESLPRITSVTSCASSMTNVESVVTHTPEPQCIEDMSLAARMSAISTNCSEKILKITRPAIKRKGKRKFQRKIVKQIKDIIVEDKKKNGNLSSVASLDATIEEVIAQGIDQIPGTSSVLQDEKKSQESPNLHVNGVSIRNSSRKGLKVLRPVRRIKCRNSAIQSNIDNVNSVAEESVDRSGLPSIKNVVSLANDHALDDCLEEANQKLSSINGLYTTNTPEKKLKVIKPVVKDDGFQIPSEMFENLDIDLQSGNDDFNFAVESLIEDISRKKLGKKSPIKSKVPPPSLRKQFAPSNVKNKGLKVLKPVIRRKKRGKRKAMFTRRKLRVAENMIKSDTDNVENTIPNAIENVENSVQNSTNDVDLMGLNFADLNLVDTESTFVNSEYNDASLDKNTSIKMNILHSKLSPTKSFEKHKSDTNNLSKEQIESADNYIAEPSNNSETAVEGPLDDSIRVLEEHEELLEEVPLQQRRCNNFYVKVPTGEELGSNINLEEYEKFFSIQDENHPTKKIRKTEIESLDNDEDLSGSPGKRRTKCSKCDRTFVSSAIRKIHEATCENTDPQSSECSKCGRWFARTASRKIHEKKCQKVYGTIEIPVTPLNDVLRCAMCPFSTGHKTAYINHLKSHMYSHKKATAASSRTAALRRKFGYRRKKKRRLRFGVLKNRCEICSDDAAGVEHMVSRCRRCGAFNLQWCDVCQKGGYSTACRLRHHDTECPATPHTRCNDVPRVRVERIGPPLPLHCMNCDVTRILYIREKRCKQCSCQLFFKCEMCAELRDTYAELCGHVARAHIYGCLVQCGQCGQNCEDMTLHERVCESQRKEGNAVNAEGIHFSDDEDSNEETQRIMDNLILDLDEDSDEEQMDGSGMEEESDEEQLRGFGIEEESYEANSHGLEMQEESDEEQPHGLDMQEESDNEQPHALEIEEESDEEELPHLRLEEESGEEQLRIEGESGDEQLRSLRVEEESDEEQQQNLKIEEV